MSGDQADIQQLLGKFLNQHKLGQGFVKTAHDWYIPLAEELLLHHKSAAATLFVGVNGSQGSGKSTLCDFILEYLTQIYGLHVISMSLDDFYYGSAYRANLASEVHPLLATRGVPGTHDVRRMQSTFEALAANQLPVRIPRFDKATDNPRPESEWLTISVPVDLVLMEGWCWGICSQDEIQLSVPVNGLEELEDIDASWRGYVNDSLKEAYEPLYDYMHCWVMLKAPGFDAVHDWRCEQEHKLKQKLATENINELSGIMSDSEILRFIQHYQRLTEHGLATLPASCDSVIELGYDRSIVRGKLG